MIFIEFTCNSTADFLIEISFTNNQVTFKLYKVKKGGILVSFEL